MVLSRRQAIGTLGASVWAVTAGCSRNAAPPTDPRSDGPLHYQTLREVAQRLQSRELSAVDLTESILARIAAVDGRLQSYATVMADNARAAARAADAEIRQGRYRGPLHGVPVAVKDLCYTKGTPTMGGTPVYANFVPEHDATVVTKLHDAGAVVVGKLNLTEGAMAGYHRQFRIPRNPWRADWWAGVSSSGSGVATAAGLCYGAIGTDTGGSIRYPSAANAIVGLKPTYGRVSRHGVLALAESLDHVGPMARTVADVAVMFEIMAGHDPADQTSLADRIPRMLDDIDRGVGGLRLGVNRAYTHAGVPPEDAAATENAIRTLEGIGARLVEVELPDFTAMEPVWWALCAREAFNAHAAHYPVRAAEYGPWFREWLDTGSKVSDAEYERADKARAEFATQYRAMLDSVDALVGPAFGPWSIPEDAEYGTIAEMDAIAKRFREQFTPPLTSDFIYTFPANLAGVPALTLPSGFTAEGRPQALQIIGRRLSEATLCRIGQAYERATDWHNRHPSV